MKHKVHQR